MGQKRGNRAAEKARRGAKQQRRERARSAKLRAALRRLGHETMLRLPAFAKAVDGLVGRLRTPPGAPPRLVTERDLMDTPEVDEMLQSRGALMTQLHGWTHEEALVEIQHLCCHVQCGANYELSGRKAFWVSASLATLLRDTALDIGGDLLRLPYPTCAFVFDDVDTLSAIEQLVDDDPKLVRGPARIEVLTVYACPLEDQPGVRLIYLADRFDGEWPILLSRDIPTGGTRHLDEILDSHPEESADPMFRTEAMRRAVHLVINAILYTTSKEFVSEPRQPIDPAWASHPASISPGKPCSTCRARSSSIQRVRPTPWRRATRLAARM